MCTDPSIQLWMPRLTANAKIKTKTCATHVSDLLGMRLEFPPLTMALKTWAAKIAHTLTPPEPLRTLGPSRAWREAILEGLRPASADVRNCSSSSGVERRKKGVRLGVVGETELGATNVGNGDERVVIGRVCCSCSLCLHSSLFDRGRESRWEEEEKDGTEQRRTGQSEQNISLNERHRGEMPRAAGLANGRMRAQARRQVDHPRTSQGISS